MTGNFAHLIYTAGKHGTHQFTAREAVYPALNSIQGARKGFRHAFICCCCKQTDLGEGIVSAEQGIATVEQNLELTADAVIIHRGGKYNHIGIMHHGSDLGSIVLDHAAPQLVASEASLAEAILLFPQIYGLYLISGLLCTFGKGCCQSFGIAVKAGI